MSKNSVRSLTLADAEGGTKLECAAPSRYETTVNTTETQKAFLALVQDPETEKRADALPGVRKAWVTVRDQVSALKAADTGTGAKALVDGQFVDAREACSLAGRSANAVKEKSLISDSVERVEQGFTLVDQAGETQSEVVGMVQHVSDIVSEISAASSLKGQAQDRVQSVAVINLGTQDTLTLRLSSA